MINVDVSAKIWENVRYVKKKLFGILVHTLVKRVDIWEVLLVFSRYLC